MYDFFRANKEKYGRDLVSKRERHSEIQDKLPEMKRKLEEREGTNAVIIWKSISFRSELQKTTALIAVLRSELCLPAKNGRKMVFSSWFFIFFQ